MPPVGTGCQPCQVPLEPATSVDKASLLFSALALWMSPCKATGSPHTPRRFQEVVLCFLSLAEASPPHAPWQDEGRRQAWGRSVTSLHSEFPSSVPPSAVVLAVLSFLPFLP